MMPAPGFIRSQLAHPHLSWRTAHPHHRSTGCACPCPSQPPSWLPPSALPAPWPAAVSAAPPCEPPRSHIPPGPAGVMGANGVGVNEETGNRGTNWGLLALKWAEGDQAGARHARQMLKQGAHMPAVGPACTAGSGRPQPRLSCLLSPAVASAALPCMSVATDSCHALSACRLPTLDRALCVPPPPPRSQPHLLEGIQVSAPHVLLSGGTQALHSLLPLLRLLQAASESRRVGRARGQSA